MVSIASFVKGCFRVFVPLVRNCVPYLASLDPSGEVHRAVRSPGVERRTGGIFRLTRAYHLSDPWPWHLAVIGKVLLNGLLNIANRWILAMSAIENTQK